MKTVTEASLDKSREFLTDCVEASHLLLKRKLEALRRGEDVDWGEMREVVREGRTAARQLTQIASLEVRDRQQSERRERPRREARPRPQLKVQPTPQMAIRFATGVMDWQKVSTDANRVMPMPDDLRALLIELGLDPANPESIEVLFEVFEGQAKRAAA